MTERWEDSMSDAWELRLREQRDELDPGLRRKVLGAVRSELRADGGSSLKWRRWLAAAAAYLAWMHCAWSAAQDGRSLAWIASRNEINERAEQIRQLVPELTREEARRQAILYSVALPPTMGTFR